MTVDLSVELQSETEERTEEKLGRKWGEMNKSDRFAWLFERHTMKELFQMLPDNLLEKISTILLMVLSACPFLCNMSFIPDVTIFDWNVINLQVGYLGILMGIMMIYSRRAKGERTLIEEWKNPGLPLFFTLLLLWSLVACVCSTNPMQSLLGDVFRKDGVTAYFAYAGIILMASQIKEKKYIKLLLNVLTATGSLIALAGIDFIYQTVDVIKVLPDTGVFDNQNHYGYYLCMLIPMTMGLFIEQENRKRRILYGIELALLSNGLIKCRSLGPFLAVMTAMAMMMILVAVREKRLVYRGVRAVLICMVVMVLTSLSRWNIFQDVVHTLFQGLEWREAGATGKEKLAIPDRFGSGRGVLWKNTLRLIGERPLTGFGPDNLGQELYDAGCGSDRPHCELLQIAASLGIPALLFYVGGLLDLLKRFVKEFKGITTWQIMLYCVVGSYLISSLVGNTMYYTTPFFFMMLGICYGAIIKLEPEKEN